MALGRHGVIATGEARKQGAEILARIRAGNDPEPGAAEDRETAVTDLAERYLREHVAVRCKPLTLKNYRQVMLKNVLPVLGRIPVAALERRHVAEFHYQPRRKPVSANEAVHALSRMLNRIESWGMVPPGSNPCRGMRKYRTRRLKRFLTPEEYRRVGAAL